MLCFIIDTILFCSVSWTPSFLLKRYILSGIHDGPHEPFIADSVDFVVGQVSVKFVHKDLDFSLGVIFLIREFMLICLVR